MTNNVVSYTMRNELLGHAKSGGQHGNSFFDFKLASESSNRPPAASSERPMMTCRVAFRSGPTIQSIFNSPCLTSKLPCILREHEFDLTGSNLNKIFCSQWLDDRFAIMGSKCNKLVILDTQTGKYTIKDPVKSHPNSVQIADHCGIHAISINPSRTLLATGAENVNDIAIYSLPGMEPHSIGYNAHSYWIFDIVWLDDNHVVSGAGDNRLALWSIDAEQTNGAGCGYGEKSPAASMPIGKSLARRYLEAEGHYEPFPLMNQNRHVDRSLMKRTLSSSPFASSEQSASSSHTIRPRPSVRPSSSVLSQPETTNCFNPFHHHHDHDRHQPNCPHFQAPRFITPNQIRRSTSFSNPSSTPSYSQTTLAADSRLTPRSGGASSQQPSTTSRRLANHVVYAGHSSSVSLNPRYQYNPFLNTSTAIPQTSSNSNQNTSRRLDPSTNAQDLPYVDAFDYSEVITDDEDDDIEEQEEDEDEDDSDDSDSESDEEDDGLEHRAIQLSEYVSFARRVIRAGPLDTSLPANYPYNIRSKRMTRSRTAIDLSGFTRSSPVDSTFSSQYYVNETGGESVRDDYDNNDNDEEDAVRRDGDAEDERNFCDRNAEDDSDSDEDDEAGSDGAVKRRRLNSRGKFKHSGKTGIRYQKPTKLITCKQSKRIRALAYNPRRNEIAAISMNAAFHYFDVKRFEQKYTKKLSPLKENVCLAINDDYTIYAIGSASHVQLLDANNARPLTNPIFIKNDIGVRSVHFRNNILSIGTGIGTVLFYDLKTNHFLRYSDYGVEYVPPAPKITTENTNANRHEDSSPATDNDRVKFQTNRGWLMRNETYYENLPYIYPDSSHAIYSHSYDPSGTKLLTAGGPLTVNLYGHYVAVWR